MKIVGISCNLGVSLKQSVHKVNANYIKALEKAGCAVVIIPQVEEAILNGIVDHLDGIVFTGGDDIDPEFYHEEKSKYVKKVDLNRDHYEFALLKRAIKRKLPVLGICRGCQLINVYLGGSLYQDCRLCPSNTLNHKTPANKAATMHNIVIRNDSFLEDILGEVAIVNSYHHQAINKVGKDLLKIALSNDGIVEGIQHKYLPIVGLQFHPEKNIEEDHKMQMIFNKWVKEL
ncbi:MAG: gamma-glutamyl-gamma-aminobutyrate hydrolase family protein [Erysipelotrichaceae bacterium]|nr:gamma-glutamyl-gamma-aminobutyrate hydrolase family protein [Erysipelotrichaceae bacterium]MDY5252098.1 gamma-glutamyl-gamma-aminobutyrate hydrolase family protein [Erysipelotrichaceae bacterium]